MDGFGAYTGVMEAAMWELRHRVWRMEKDHFTQKVADSLLYKNWTLPQCFEEKRAIAWFEKADPCIVRIHHAGSVYMANGKVGENQRSHHASWDQKLSKGNFLNLDQSCNIIVSLERRWSLAKGIDWEKRLDTIHH